MLKNYTTKVPVSKSIGEIISFLVEAGASNISQDFDSNQDCTAIKFVITHVEQSVIYKLQPKPGSAERILLSARKRVDNEVKEKVRKQSYMVAWRILRDWVDAQCALIKLEQATPLELFLSYAYNPAKDETFYDRIEAGNLKLLN